MFRLLTAFAMSVTLTAGLSSADAKTPGRTYCFNGVCHAVKTLEETRRLVGKTTTVKASYYDDSKRDRYNPTNLTSSGEYFRAWKADNAASPIYPNGTKLLVWHPGTRKAVTVRINNAGPYWRDRMLDLSRGAAEALDMGGTATLHVRVLEAPTRAEATYSKGRTYAPVKGYMGRFASLAAAFDSAGGASSPSVGGTAVAAVERPVTREKASPAAPESVVAQGAPEKNATKSSPVGLASAVPVPPDAPIEISRSKRTSGPRSNDDGNPIAEAINRLAEREVENVLRFAELH